MSNDVQQIITTKGLKGYKSLPVSQNTALLLSTMYGFVWEPGKNVISHCEQCGNTPQVGCGCGIYAHSNFDDHLHSPYSNPDHVIVELELWGIIHQFTQGYRAQYAKIVKIFIPRSGDAIPLAARRDSLELNYMVPVETIVLPMWHNVDGANVPINQPREKPITISDLELFVNSDEVAIRDFCRKELKKKYAQKISAAKRRLQYGKNMIERAEKDLLLYENARAAIPR